MSRVVVSLVLVVSLASSARAAGREKLLFLGVTGGEGFTEKQLGTIEELIVGDLQKDDRLEVMSRSAIRDLLGVEAQKQALGCDENQSCMTELAGAVGAPIVARASVGKLGSNTVVALSVLDAQNTKQLARPTRTIYSDDELPDTLQDLVTEALATMRGEKYVPKKRLDESTGFSLTILPNVGIDYDNFGETRLLYGAEAIVAFGSVIVVPRVLLGSEAAGSTTGVAAEVGYVFDPRRIGLNLPKPGGLDMSLAVTTGPAVRIATSEGATTVFQWGLRAVFLAQGEHVVLSAGVGSHVETAPREPIDIDLAAGWKF